jgi:heme-degrading monooxygenase HmoA
MTDAFVAINAITVPEDAGDELAKRFAARAGAVDKQDGFEEFQLLRPADGKNTWYVYTRWRDKAAFDAWVSSPAFGHGHTQAAADAANPPPRPVSTASELLSFTVETRNGPGV